MKRSIITALMCGILFGAASAQDAQATAYGSIENVDFAAALAAVNTGAMGGWGYPYLDVEDQVFTTGFQTYTDMMIVLKRVKYRLQLDGSTLQFAYFDHEQEDKTRGQWETIPKLTKKDKKTFDKAIAGISAILNDKELLDQAYADFFTNGNHLPVLFDACNEEQLATYNELAKERSGRFIWVAFKKAETNQDEAYSDYAYKVTWVLVPQTPAIKEKYKEEPLYLIHYANNQPDRDKEKGLFDDIEGLTPDVYPTLAGTIKELKRDTGGKNFVVITDQ